MPKRILVSQRSKFWALYRAGHTIKEASKRSGFSESYGKGLVRNGIGPGGVTNNLHPDDNAREVEAEEAARPKRRDELSPVALDCLEDFGRFRARYLGSVSPPWQEEAAQIVIRHVKSGGKSWGIINCPQGSGKTRLFSHDIAAWLVARDRTIRMILGSAGLTISYSLAGNLRDTFERTVPARAREGFIERGLALDAETTMSTDYGRFKPGGSGNLWRREQFTVEQVDGIATQDKEPTCSAFSYEAKFLSARVDYYNWDDVHTSRDMRNPDKMRDIFEWFDMEAESRLEPGGLGLVTMQRLGANDISNYLLGKIDPSFEIDADQPDKGPKQYFHVKFKAHYEDRCDGNHGKDGPNYPDGCMLWRERISDADMRAKKIAGIFDIVYQQEDVDPSSQLVRQSWVDGGLDPFDGVAYPGCWDEERSYGEIPDLTPGSIRYITVDPSPTKFWAIQDWIYTPVPDTAELVGMRHLVDVERIRMQANELLDWSNDQQSWVGILDEWVLRAKEQGMPVGTLIFEQNAAQRWVMHYEQFQRWQRTRGVQVIPHNTHANKSDPDLGIETLLPAVYRLGRVRLPAKGLQARTKANYLVREVTQWPNGATDDQPMAQWFGEFHLPSLVGANQKVRSVYSDIPTWMRDAERRVLSIAGQ